MSTLTDTGMPTLADIAAMEDPNGAVAKITNTLTKKNDLLTVLPWVESNETTGHELHQTGTTLGTATWRMVNKGVDQSKADEVVFIETCARLEREITIDEALIAKNGMAWVE